MTAREKQLVINNWIRFLKNGCQFKNFSKRLYNHLTLNCSFIAHFDRSGFYATYFNEPEDTKLFLSQFLKGKSIEYGMTGWWLDDKNYADINTAMCDIAKQLAPIIINTKSDEQRQLDVKRAEQLLAKHNLELQLK